MAKTKTKIKPTINNGEKFEVHFMKEGVQTHKMLTSIVTEEGEN